MRCNRTLSRLGVSLLSTVLSYAIVVTLLPPRLRSAEAALSGGAAPTRKGFDLAAALRAQAAAPRRQGELLVRFRADITEEGKDGLSSSQGARRKGKLRGGSRLERIELPAGQDPAASAEKFRAHPEVEIAEPNFIISGAQVTPDDARFSEQWALKNTGQAGGGHDSDVRAAQAWQAATGSASTLIAVVDGGIDFTHPDLRANEWNNPREQENGRDDDRDGFADDLHGWDWVAGGGAITDGGGHGTAVAGIIAAEGNNGQGISGVMWRAGLMSLRVLDSEGNGDVASAVEAIDYAVAHGASVVNCSWGTAAPSAALRDAISRAGAAGVLVVASGGNSGRDIDADAYYPASFALPNVVAVAATDASDKLAAFSNWGAAVVQVGAPGVGVLTTARGGGYESVTGTSAAAPVVAGVAGLIKSLRPALKAERAREALVRTARSSAGLSGKVESGGVADASAALALVASWPAGADYDVPPGGADKGDGAGGDNAGGNGNGAAAGGGPKNGGGQKDTNPPRPGRLRQSLPDLDAVRRKPSDPIKAPKANPSTRRDYRQPGEPVKAPGETISADSVETGRYTGSTLGVARLDPSNRTGLPGEDLFSGNFNWELPLLNLPGRSGLDLGISLSYNSLVWTKLGYSYIFFDTDAGFPSPGFRLNFPVVQSQFYDETVGQYAYMLVTPAGRRVELRQVNGSSTYESADSTYMQLIDYGSTKLLRNTDGSQYTLADDGAGQFKCTQVKDRNGNYISVAYSGGRIATITDTLGRVLYFNYDGNARLSTITQVRNGSPFTWATFGYSNLYVQPTFSGLWVYGPYNQTISVLTSVWTADSSRYDFAYNSFAQVYRIDRVAPAGNLMTRTTYNLPSAPTTQYDCPRFTERRDWVAEWNGDDGSTYSPAEEAVTTFGTEPGDVQTVTMPDSTVHKEFFATSGWGRGLVTQRETWSGGSRRKWETNSWTQDNTGVGYPLNPRVYETNVYDVDSGRRRRMTVEYHASFGLPHIILEYAADAATVVRRTYLDYKNDSFYVDRRIIGLLYQRLVYDGSWNLFGKTQYSYDEGGDRYVAQAPSVQYDSTNYPSWFIVGRGNVTGVVRYNVFAEFDGGQAIWTQKAGYNMAGSPVWAEDGSGHRTNISYADSFSDGVDRGTLGYATSQTDPDGFTESAQYDYSTGLRTREQDPKGAVKTLEYDAAGRVTRVTTPFNGAYQRWVYPSTLGYVLSLTTVNTANDEGYTNEVVDGLGRVIAVATNNPNSTGGYKAQQFTYDIMGRKAQTTNPTEIDGSWNPSGDDAAGWLTTYQSYDWDGRERVTTKPGGATEEATYDGCGCAGGLSRTMTDEVGRRVRTAYDALGREWVTEVLNTDGSVYRSTTNTYNTRDQITRVDDYAPSTGATQVTLISYDGHGRVATRQPPEATAPVTYAYNADDTLQSATDGRGAVTTYSYNGRHLATAITSTLGYSSTSASFAYDEAGNRTQMNDDNGYTTYAYNTLSQMTGESRYIYNLGASFPISYTYNLAGRMNSVTDPFGSTVYHNYDDAGRVESVTGTAYAGVTTYASSVRYRAWGGVKSASFGDGTAYTTSFDNRMRPWQYRFSWQRLDYAYYADGRLLTVTDLDDGPGSNPPTTLHFMSRGYTYDHTGRVLHGGGTNSGAPFQQDYTYDPFDNMTSRSGTYGYNYTTLTDTATYTNNRRNGWTYDQDGRLTYSPANSSSNARTWAYDPAGRQTSTSETAGTVTDTLSVSYDGNGRSVREQRTGSTPVTYYLIRSSVLGGEVLTRLNSNGTKAYTYVPANGLVMPRQTIWSYNGQQQIEWSHLDPQGVTEPGATYDPLHNYVAHIPPPPPPQPPSYNGWYGPSYGGGSSSFSNAGNYSTGCMAASGNPSDCNGTAREGMTEEFWSNLPGVYNDMARGEALYAGYVSWVSSGNNPRDYHWGWLPDQVTVTGDGVNDMVVTVTATGFFEEDAGSSDRSLGVLGLKTFEPVQQGKKEPPPEITERCKKGLIGAKKFDKTLSAVRRARAHTQELQQIGNEFGVDWKIMGAIAIRETGVANLKQPGGLGRGFFQVDLGAHSDAKDIMTLGFADQGRYALDKQLMFSFNFYKERGYDDQMSMIGAIHDYNSSPWYRTKKHKREHDRTRDALDLGSPDAAINRLNKTTTWHNYVTNIFDLMDCFQ